MDDNMNKAIAKDYVLGKTKELLRLNIYQSELLNKGKDGSVKMQSVLDNFWNKLREFIKKEKEVDRSWIPNFLEDMAEDTLLGVIDDLQDHLTIRDVAQKLFDLEKKGSKVL